MDNMQPAWRLISERRASEPDMIIFDALVESASPWLCGHFPQAPIVPGVAQLSIVADMIIAAERTNGNTVKITGFKKIRFRKIVKPDDRMTIELIRNKSAKGFAYSFRIAVEQSLAGTGIAIAENL